MSAEVVRPQAASRSSVAMATGATAVVAAGIVLHRIGAKPLWLDESVSVSVARRPLPRLLAVLAHHDANAGLYDVLLHAWGSVGRTAAWDRGLSAACFVATVGLVTWAAGGRFGARWGVVGGVLVATNPFLVFYGQEARPYALTVLLAVASTVALFGDADERAPGAYVLATAALIYADLFAVLFVVAQAVGVTAVRQWRGERLPVGLVRSWAIVAAATAPLALLTLVRQHSQISWLTRPHLHDLGHVYLEMTVGWVGLAAVVGLTILAARHGRDERAIVAALAAAFAAPPLVLWLISQAVPAFIDRYVIASTVAGIGCVVIGLRAAASSSTVARAVAAALLVAVAAAGAEHVVAFEGKPYKYEDPPAVVSFILHQARSGDAIGFGGGGLRTVIDLYVPAHQPFPTDVAVAPGGEAWRQLDIYAREVGAATLARRLAAVDRVWLVTDPSDRRYPSDGSFGALRPEVAAQFGAAVRGTFPGIDVTLYVRTQVVASEATPVKR